MRSNMASEMPLSLTPGFSRVLLPGRYEIPFQRFLASQDKPLKRFGRRVLRDTQLKLGVNEISTSNS